MLYMLQLLPKKLSFIIILVIFSKFDAFFRQNGYTMGCWREDSTI